MAKAAPVVEKGDRADVGGICIPTVGTKVYASLGQLSLLKLSALRKPGLSAGYQGLRG